MTLKSGRAMDGSNEPVVGGFVDIIVHFDAGDDSLHIAPGRIGQRVVLLRESGNDRLNGGHGPKLWSVNVDGIDNRDDSVAHLRECRSLKALNDGGRHVTPRRLT